MGIGMSTGMQDGRSSVATSKDAQERQYLSDSAKNDRQSWRVKAMKSIDQLSTAESDALPSFYPKFKGMRNSASLSDFAQIHLALAQIRSKSEAPSAGLTKACGTFAETVKKSEKNLELIGYRLKYLMEKIANEEEKADAYRLYAALAEEQQQELEYQKRLCEAEEEFLKNQIKEVYREERDNRNLGLLREGLAASIYPAIEDVPVVTTTVYCEDTYEAEILSAPYNPLSPSGAAKPPLTAPFAKGSAETAAKSIDPAPEQTQVVHVKPPVRCYKTVSETQMVRRNLRLQISSHRVKPYAGEGSSTKTHIGDTWMLPGNVEASRKYVMHTTRLDTSHSIGPTPEGTSQAFYALPKMPQEPRRVEPPDARYARPQAPQVSHVLQASQLSRPSQPSQPSKVVQASQSWPAKPAFDMSPWQAIKEVVFGRGPNTVVKRSFPFPPTISPPSSTSQSRSPSQPASSPAHVEKEVAKRMRQGAASSVVFRAIAPAPVPPPDRLASLVTQLRGTTWDGDAIDLAVSLLVRLPEWPRNRILIIEDEARALSNALLPPGNRCFAQSGGACHGERIRQSLPPEMVDNAIRVQRVLLKEGVEHFNAIVDGQVRRVARDGDCFFRSALASTLQVQPCNISQSDVMRLRNQLADYLQKHAVELAGFLGETESLHAMRVQGMTLDASIPKKIRLRPTPLDEERKKIIEARTAVALQKWQDFTDKQRLEIGIDQFMMIHELTRPGDRNFFCLTGLMPRGQTCLNRLLGVRTIHIGSEHLIEWRDMDPVQREETRLLTFAERYKLNPSTCQRYICRTGLTKRGVLFLANPPRRTGADITFDILKEWWKMAPAERRAGGGVDGFAKKFGLNSATLRNRISLRGIRHLPKRLSHLSQDGEDGSGQITCVEAPSRPKKLILEKAVSSDARIREKPTEAAVVELVAACRTWEGMTPEQRCAIGIADFARDRKLFALFGPNVREHFCLEGGGLKPRGQALLDKHDGVVHTPITLTHLQEWGTMTQEKRNEITVVGFAKRNRLNSGSTTRYLGTKGLTDNGRILHDKLSASCSPDIPTLVSIWAGLSAEARSACNFVKGFAEKHKVSVVLLSNYICGDGLRPRGEKIMARRLACPDIAAVRVVEHYAQIPSVVADAGATAAVAISATVAIKTEPIEAMETIETINSHTYDNTAPYSRDPDNPERSLKPQSGKKLKIDMNRDLQNMLDAMPDAERLKFMESIHDQVTQWIRDEGDVAAARMEALMETGCPVDDGPARGDSVFAGQDIKKFQVIGCYGGKVLRSDDGSYERECRKHGAANIAAYAFDVPERNALLSGYRASNILSKINSVHPDQSMPRHLAWLEKRDNLRACSAGKHLVFIVAIEDIAAGQELFLPYGDSYKMHEHRPTVVKTEIDDDARPDVGVDAGVSVADIDAHADTLEVMRIKGRKEKRGGRTLLDATELTFLRSFPAEEGKQYALYNQRTGWHLLDERPAVTEVLPPRYRYLAPLISLSTQLRTQQRFEGQYYFYFARRDVYLPVAPTSISTNWRVQSPDGKDTEHILKYDGDDKVWHCGAIVLDFCGSAAELTSA
jgi:hypothetical protein